jgi:hypothetical protein
LELSAPLPDFRRILLDAIERTGTFEDAAAREAIYARAHRAVLGHAREAGAEDLDVIAAHLDAAISSIEEELALAQWQAMELEQAALERAAEREAVADGHEAEAVEDSAEPADVGPPRDALRERVGEDAFAAESAAPQRDFLHLPVGMHPGDAAPPAPRRAARFGTALSSPFRLAVAGVLLLALVGGAFLLRVILDDDGAARRLVLPAGSDLTGPAAVGRDIRVAAEPGLETPAFRLVDESTERVANLTIPLDDAAAPRGVEASIAVAKSANPAPAALLRVEYRTTQATAQYDVYLDPATGAAELAGSAAAGNAAVQDGGDVWRVTIRAPHPDGVLFQKPNIQIFPAVGRAPGVSEDAATGALVVTALDAAPL